jgi:hypothetical protein
MVVLDWVIETNQAEGHDTAGTVVAMLFGYMGRSLSCLVRACVDLLVPPGHPTRTAFASRADSAAAHDIHCGAQSSCDCAVTTLDDADLAAQRPLVAEDLGA